jgi:hypothetical protein
VERSDRRSAVVARLSRMIAVNESPPLASGWSGRRLSMAISMAALCLSTAWQAQARQLQSRAAESPASPFVSASLAPPDIDFLLRIRGFPQVWSSLEHAPIGRFLSARFAESDLARSWRRFADERGDDPRRLAAQLLPRDATWMARRNGDREEWVFLTRLGASERRNLLAHWRPRPLGRGWFDLEREGLLIVESEDHLVFAGSGSRDLLADVVLRLEGLEPLASIRDRWALVGREELQEGEIECYLDRRPWSDAAMLATASVEPGALVAELHSAEPNREAFGQRASLHIDETFASLIGHLKSEHLVVVASAAGVPMPLASEWLATLPEAAMAPALGSAAGVRRLWVVGETAGMGDDPDRTLPTPAIAFAVELQDPALAEARLDRWGTLLADGFNRRFPALANPPLAAASTIDGGSIDLGPLLTRMLGEHPLARRTRVDWSVASGDRGSWAIVASGPAWLRSMQGEFESGSAAAAPADLRSSRTARELETTIQEGWFRGDRVGRHFERWVESADRLSSEDQRRAFTDRWRRISEAATAMGEVRWTVVRSTSGAIRTQIRLALPDPSDEIRPGSLPGED